jgi:undecaprenyl-diphosphatase
VLIPWLFGWKDAGFTFDVALHTGTLAAILIYFFRDWVQNTNGIRLLRRK